MDRLLRTRAFLPHAGEQYSIALAGPPSLIGTRNLQRQAGQVFVLRGGGVPCRVPHSGQLQLVREELPEAVWGNDAWNPGLGLYPLDLLLPGRLPEVEDRTPALGKIGFPHPPHGLLAKEGVEYYSGLPPVEAKVGQLPLQKLSTRGFHTASLLTFGRTVLPDSARASTSYSASNLMFPGVKGLTATSVLGEYFLPTSPAKAGHSSTTSALNGRLTLPSSPLMASARESLSASCAQRT